MSQDYTNPILPEFQEFLISREFVSKKNASYYAYWVSKFLDFSNHNEELPLDMRIAKFISLMKKQKNIDDWQVKQAYRALQLYIDHFVKRDTSLLSPNSSSLKPRNEPNPNEIIGKIRNAIRLKHYSYKTERSYIDWAKRFYNYCIEVKKNTDIFKVNSDDVKDFLSYLAINKRVSSSTQNQAFNALLFLFREVLNIELKGISEAVRAKRGPKLPVVLTVEETQKLFKHVKGKTQLIIQLLYGSGLRLMELARLRVQDIDLDANQIFIRGAKGDKDRVTMLPQYVKEQLHLHLQEVKALYEKDLAAGYGEVYLPDALSRKYPNAAKEWHWQYIFPSSKLSVDPHSGKVRRHHISEKSIQNAVANAARTAGISKHITVHTLRHSFATHLLMNGVNIREIQDLLGHKNLETTMIYTHVLRNLSKAPKSPLDTLYINGSHPEEPISK